MEWNDIDQHNLRIVNIKEHNTASNGGPQYQQIGGIIRHGECAWVACGCSLQIVSLRNGQTISTYDFDDLDCFEDCFIKHIAEICPNKREDIMLAVCLENLRGNKNGSSFIALFSIDNCNVVSSTELPIKISSICMVDPSVCHGSLFNYFDGCLAVGGEDGNVILINLNLQNVANSESDNICGACYIVEYTLSLADIRTQFKESQKARQHFGVSLEIIDNPCSVQCICPINLILGLAIGLEDGRLVVYDLAELQIFYVTEPEHPLEMCPIVKLDYLEPNDDPRSCVYIFVVHEGEKNLAATLHMLVYERRCIDGAISFFERFQAGFKRLRMPLDMDKCTAVSCQSIFKLATHGEENSACLCAVTWNSFSHRKNKLIVFDLNQWYKEQMPFTLGANCASFVAGYIIGDENMCLDGYLNPATIAYFNSMQRSEEHFYPNSLSFDFVQLFPKNYIHYNLVGIQNQFISKLRSSNAGIFLQPDMLLREIFRAHLIPYLMDLNSEYTLPNETKYDIVLSSALENNCFSLLRDCARCWADGSFVGQLNASTGLSLSTLTNWACKRADLLHNRCTELSKSIFGIDSCPLDQREQKEYGFLTRQLKLLVNLFKDILMIAKTLPDKVYSQLERDYNRLRLISEYQEFILWLLNIGFLPESAMLYNFESNKNLSKPYSYLQLRALYMNKRRNFAKINESYVSKQTGQCRLLYIDCFIQRMHKDLRQKLLLDGGDGLYPPVSVESMLRIFLLPDIAFESKCAMLLYFFLDLHMIIDEDAYKHVVSSFIKFPSVFKMPAPLVKIVQTFWNLDHDHFLSAVEEFISPFHQNENHPEWMVELLIEALVVQDAPNLALRVLEANARSVSPVLHLKTLLSNNLISEAFHFARLQYCDSFLELFFSYCLGSGHFAVIRDLALTEKEGQLLQTILKRNKSSGGESLHFVYLLQKSKFIEAVSYMDELSKTNRSHSSLSNTVTENPNLVLSAFSTTMAPVTQNLTDIYFRIKNKLKKKETDNKSPVPLSCQLIKQNANNLLGGIYHSSALSAHFATYYWGEMDSEKKDASSLMNSNNAPFLRKPQTGVYYCDNAEKNKMLYPEEYKPREKRRLSRSESINPNENDSNIEMPEPNPKKRQRLDEKEILENFNYIKKMNKPAISLKTFGLGFADMSGTQLNESHGLEQRGPTMTSQRSYACQRNVASSAIQGILRNTASTEAGDRSSIRRETHMEEEKSLRFNLPESTSAASTSGDVDCSMTAAVNDEPELRHKQIARTISTDSKDSEANSKAESDDDFYSPLQSLNNSSAVVSDDSNKKLGIPFREKSSFGPQPRKTLQSFLHRANVEEHEPISTTIPQQSDSVDAESDLNVDSESTKEKDMNVTLLNTTSSQFTHSKLRSSLSIKKTNDFTPLVSSSKVCSTQSIFIRPQQKSDIKYSEHTTVVGGVTYVETTTEESKEEIPPSVELTLEHEDLGDRDKRNPMLDTTLDMSSYEGDANENRPQTDAINQDPSVENSQASVLGNQAEDVIELSSSSASSSAYSKDVGAAIDVDSDNETDSDSNAQDESTIEEYDEGNKNSQSISSSDSDSEKSTQEDLQILEDASRDAEESAQSRSNQVINLDDDDDESDLELLVQPEELAYNRKSTFTDLTKWSSVAAATPNEDEFEAQEEPQLPMNLDDPCGAALEETPEDEALLFLHTYEAEPTVYETVMDVSEELPENILESQTSAHVPSVPTTSVDTMEAIIESEHDVRNSGEEQMTVSDIFIGQTGDDQVIVSPKDSGVGVEGSRDTEASNGTMDISERVSESQGEYDKRTESAAKENIAFISPDDTAEEVLSAANEPESAIGATGCESSNIAATITDGCEVDTVKVSTTNDNHDNQDMNKDSLGIREYDGNSERATNSMEAEKKLDDKSEPADSSANEGRVKVDGTDAMTTESTVSEGEESIVLQVDEDTHDKEHESVQTMKDASVRTHQLDTKGEQSVTVEEAEKNKATENPTFSIFATSSALRTLSPLGVQVVENVLQGRRKRGTSMPPQSEAQRQSNNDHANGDTPRVAHPRRKHRASSVQPNTEATRSATAKMFTLNMSPESNVDSPLQHTPGRIMTRRATREQSVTSDITPKNMARVDSPASRTRSRLRLSSVDSEVEALSMGAEQVSQSKRTRRTSVSSNLSETTPSRAHVRRLSVNSQSEVGSPRPPSVMSSETNSPLVKRTATKRATESQSRDSPIESSLLNAYSDNRRLTRHQLAMLEKSSSLYVTASKVDTVDSESPASRTPVASKRKSTRSIVGSVDDDNESIRSLGSDSGSSVRRRSTRSSAREKVVDDDVISVASSVTSERSTRRRPKEHLSPSTPLATIEEDETEDTVGPKKRGRPRK